MADDYYDLLGMSRDASEEELNAKQREALERFAEASDDGDGFDLGEDFLDRIADSIA